MRSAGGRRDAAIHDRALRQLDDELDLLELLKDPFAVAMSNTLKHREVLKLRDPYVWRFRRSLVDTNLLPLLPGLPGQERFSKPRALSHWCLNVF